jgi:hypothetical protein
MSAAERDTGDSAQADASTRVMSFDEATRAYPDEWLFMQIMKMGGDGWPEEVIVLAHDRKRSVISDVEIAVMSVPPPGVIGYETIFGGPYFRTSEEWHAYYEAQQAARGRGR